MIWNAGGLSKDYNQKNTSATDKLIVGEGLIKILSLREAGLQPFGVLYREDPDLALGQALFYQV